VRRWRRAAAGSESAAWSARYPTGFHLEVSDQLYGLTTTEATVADFRLRPGIVIRHQRGGASWRVFPPLDGSGRFPADGIAVRVVIDSDAPSTPEHRNFRSPIRLSSFTPSDDVPSPLPFNGSTGETATEGAFRGAPRSIARDLHIPGEAYLAIAWIGPDAPAQARAAVNRIVASLRLPRRVR
jgi:hypothetical protein